MVLSFIPFSILRQFHSLSQSGLSTECDLVLPLSVSSILSLPLSSLSSSSSCLRLLITSTLASILPSITCFRRQFLRQLWPIQLAYLLFTACRIFLSSLILCNTSPFLTLSVQLIFSILLQHRTSKFSSYFWSTYQSVQFSAPCKVTLLLIFLLKFKSNFLVKKFSLLNSAFSMAILYLIFYHAAELV